MSSYPFKLYPILQWENHAKSLKLEEQTFNKIKDRIQEKIMNESGTWIDWQYLLDAATLLQKVSLITHWASSRRL